MDNRRFLLAIGLSVAFLALYNLFLGPKPGAMAPKREAAPMVSAVGNDGAEKETDQKTAEAVASGEPATTEPTADQVVVREESERLFTVDGPLWTAVFTNRGGALIHFVLKSYRDDAGQPLDLVDQRAGERGLYPFHLAPFGDAPVSAEANRLFFAGPEGTSWNLKNGDEATLVFRYVPASGAAIRKTFRLSGQSYVMDVAVEAEVKAGEWQELPVVWGPGLENSINLGVRLTMAPPQLTGMIGGERKELVFKKVAIPKEGVPEGGVLGSLDGFFSWVAYENTYFAAVFRGEKKPLGDVRYQVAENPAEEKAEGEDQTPATGTAIPVETRRLSYLSVPGRGAVYLGPKDQPVLEREGAAHRFVDLDKVINYGFGKTFAAWLYKGLDLVHGWLGRGNYGWTIVIFTLLLKLILFPLTYSSSVSMAKMQTLQPKMKAIKKKYRNQKDPEQRRQMNMEMMELYKREKINPAGGCLPMLIQLPILYGMYRLLAVSIVVRHEPWLLWISDLSAKDPYYVLPVLMGVTQFMTMKMTPSTGDASQKKMMTYLMPAMMLFFFLNMSSGLNLYWFVSNLIQVGQQNLINRRIFSRRKQEQQSGRREVSPRAGRKQ